MCPTCKQLVYMPAASVMIQIRNVPARVHRILKARAAMAGMSLSDYVLADLKEAVELPTQEEWLAQLAKREPVDLPAGAVAAALKEGRAGR
jgi:antitoxin FitA